MGCGRRGRWLEFRPMSGSFTLSQQQRFRKLLTLAAESPFAGERDAALAAANRMAESAGMDLEEAAGACGRSDREQAAERDAARGSGVVNEGWPEDISPSMRRAAWAGYAWEAAASRARQRQREETEMRQREEEAERRANSTRGRSNQPRSSRAMPRGDFARVLLLETGLSLRDIAEITELNIYEVVGLKLKLRPEIKRARRQKGARQATSAAAAPSS